jgi:hypothetical protein
MDPKVIATVNEIPPADSSIHAWVEALAQEASGDSAATVEYLPNAAGGYDVVVR